MYNSHSHLFEKYNFYVCILSSLQYTNMAVGRFTVKFNLFTEPDMAQHIGIVSDRVTQTYNTQDYHVSTQVRK